MSKDDLLTSECAEQARVTVNTIIRWIRTGYKKKRLAARRVCWSYRINKNTWKAFLYETGQTQ